MYFINVLIIIYFGMQALKVCMYNVITPSGGMLLVYNPDSQGHIVPEGGGIMNQQHPNWEVL